MKLPNSHIPDFRKAMAVFQRCANRELKKTVAKFALDESKSFKERIMSQGFKSFAAVPLSRNYLDRKMRAGADLRTMIATHTYVNGIEVMEYGGMTVIGFDSKKKAVDLNGMPSDIYLYEVAAIQEFGSIAAGIPPRPHWRPHLSDMRERAAGERRRLAVHVAFKVMDSMT